MRCRSTVLEKKEYILLKLLDREIAEHIELELKKKGIKILTSVDIQAIEKKKEVLRIRTSKGSFDADMIVLSTGVKPNTVLAQRAKLEIGSSGGTKVNGFLQTSDERVYAVGDCAESLNVITNTHEYWPLGSVSTKMGRIAADNICGRKVNFDGSIGTALLKIRDLNVARTGLTSRSAMKNGYDFESVVITGQGRAHYESESEFITLKVIADKKTQVLLGAQAFGRGNAVGIIENLTFAIMHSLTLIDVFKTDMGYAPSFSNPIGLAQTACLVLINKLEGLISARPKTS